MKMQEERKTREFRFSSLLGFLLTLCLCSFSSNSVAAEEPSPVLSLIVSGQDLAHARENLEKLAWMKRVRKVEIGEVYIASINEQHFSASNSEQKSNAKSKLDSPKAFLKTLMEGGERFARKVAASYSSAQKQHPYLLLLEDLELRNRNLKLLEEIVSTTKLEYSPTWIVRYRGRDYIYEGFIDPARLFTASGEFLGG